jgi:hypothetical protein
MITPEELAKWRAEFDSGGMRSAIDEYCPEEFGQLLDEVGRLRDALERIRETVHKRQLPITNQVHEIATKALGIEQEWRCIGCKLVTVSPEEPERCTCGGRTFALIDPPSPAQSPPDFGPGRMA